MCTLNVHINFAWKARRHLQTRYLCQCVFDGGSHGGRKRLGRPQRLTSTSESLHHRPAVADEF